MHKHTLHDGRATLVNADCLPYLKTLADNSVDLILTDPPYFQVKRNAWD
ncbi:site-specific DNA-methyltransferase, partial [Vibrio anguillarum]|nr:site-specific DNA-methyltransferase [Vibrio anguillarum]